MDDPEARADYYRDKAEEIRRVARRAHTLEVARELFDLANRFDRIAAYVQRRVLNAEG